MLLFSQIKYKAIHDNETLINHFGNFMYARHQISEERSRVSSSLVIEVAGLERIGIVLYLIINFVFILCISTKKKTEGLDDIDRKRIKKTHSIMSNNKLKQTIIYNN